MPGIGFRTKVLNKIRKEKNRAWFKTLEVGILASLIAGVIIIVASNIPSWWKHFATENTSAVQENTTVSSTLKKEIDAVIYRYSPSSTNPVTTIEVGKTVELQMNLTNTGTRPWKFITGATIWSDTTGQIVYEFEKRLDDFLNPGDNATVSWSYTVPAVDGYDVQFGIWEGKSFDNDILLTKFPRPSEKLFVGIPPK
jgi:Flp pilus assembly pilin Flp